MEGFLKTFFLNSRLFKGVRTLNMNDKFKQNAWKTFKSRFSQGNVNADAEEEQKMATFNS